MRRVYSIILMFVTVIGMVCSLSSCAKDELENVMTKGDYLMLICDRFGMTNYESQAPYTKTVDADSDYFSPVQTAWEWGVITDEKIKTNDLVDKVFLAETLIRCVGIEDISGMTHQESGNLAYEKGYVTYKYSGFSSKSNASIDEINECIEKSLDIWTNRHFEKVEEVGVGGDVVNVASTGIKPEEIIYDNENDVIAIPQKYVSNLKAGEVFAIPTEDSVPIDTYTHITEDNNSSENNSETNSDKNDNNDEDKNNTDDGALSAGAVYTAEKVEYVDGYAIIHKSDDVNGDVVIEDLEYSGSYYPDLTTIPMVDGAGNVINPQTSDVSNFTKPTVDTADYSPSKSVTSKDCAKMSLSFKVGDISVSGSVSNDDISVSIKGAINKKIGGNKSAKVEVSKSFSISNIGVDFDWDFKGFKLKYAYAQLSYDLKDTTGLKTSASNGSKLFIDQRKQLNLKNILTSEFRDEAASKVSKTFTIVSFPLVNAGLGRVDVDVKAVLTVSGTIELVVTTRNANGIEIKNDKIRYLNKKDKDVDINVKASIEATIYVGVGIKILINTELLGVGFEGGVGIEWVCTVHCFDSSGQHLEEVSFNGSGEFVEASIVDTYQEKSTLKLCGDVKVYGILKFTFSKDSSVYSLMKTLMKGKFSGEIEILGKKNATIDYLCAHYEEWKKVPTCTRKLGATTTTPDEIVTRTGALVGDKLDINSYSFSLKVGETEKISLTQITTKTDTSKVKFTSSNSEVAVVDNQGNIKAVGEGVARVTVKIEGSDFEMSCMVYVEK